MSSPSATGKPLHAPLDEYVRQFEDLKRDAAQLTDGLSDDQFNWAPTAERWSMAQCFDHLNAVARPYCEALARGIETTRERGFTVGGPVRYSFLERYAIRSMEPPPKRRIPAPGIFRPSASRPTYSLAETLDEYAAAKDRFVELLSSADGLDVGKVKIATPVSKLIRLRIGAAFAFLASHERRHLWQARKVRESVGFPD
ncbi:MAG: DinB family protein [Acidobacteriota bacterium]